jgi:hypothetical protein
MINMCDLDSEHFITTDGNIAVANLESARQRSWNRFFQNPAQAGAAETVIEHEHLTAQFIGDLCALDRLESLAAHLVQADSESAHNALIQAQIASMGHRFSDARHYLAQAEINGVQAPDVQRVRLNVDHACGANLDAVINERRGMATKSAQFTDLVALGTLLADLREFSEADHVYRQALRGYSDVSPFGVAWVSFQLGMLWGEQSFEPDLALAEQWYRKAISCLPCYVKARVHLAEILLGDGQTKEAQALLTPALASGDPEVRWRLADVLALEARSDEADAELDAARAGFEALLGRHLLAFADHGAEFYAGSGDDASRALELARVNVNNRPTLRAFEQAHTIAVEAGEAAAAAELLAAGTKRWKHTAAFRLSSLAPQGVAA